ncbi:hypothetical protein QUA97_12480 [Microcoleus sp. CZ3-B2]|uniref:hypothetical protein n=1 Tax=Microcoleus sp. CZ3-B2 TaxID=2818731 RepID=UPI002FD13D63
MAVDCWQLAVGSWQLAVVSCQLAVGCWLLAVGSWLLVGAVPPCPPSYLAVGRGGPAQKRERDKGRRKKKSFSP